MALLTCYRKYCLSRSILLCYISSLAAEDLFIRHSLNSRCVLLLPGGLAQSRQWFVHTRYAYRDLLHRFYIDLSCNQSWKISLGQINQSSEKSERCATNYRDQNSVDSGHSSLRSVILRVRDQRRKWQVNSALTRSGETAEDRRTTCFKLCWFSSAL